MVSNSLASRSIAVIAKARLLVTTSAISGEDIRTLVLAAVEHRYALVNCPPIGVDWLSDDSSCYVAPARYSLAMSAATRERPQSKADRPNEWTKPSSAGSNVITFGLMA